MFQCRLSLSGRRISPFTTLYDETVQRCSLNFPNSVRREAGRAKVGTGHVASLLQASFQILRSRHDHDMITPLKNIAMNTSHSHEWTL